MKIAYDIMNSEFDLEDLKYVTDPYKVGVGFPARMQNINIVRPKIELLKGEESKRPESFVVFRTDEAAVEEITQKQKDMIYQAIEESLMVSNTNADEESMKYLQDRLAKIKEYITKDYYDPAEQTAVKTLKYLREKLDIKDEFMKGWEDALIVAEEIYYTGVVNGEPILERVNPMYFAYDRDPDLKYVDEGEWHCRLMWMSPSAVHDRFYDILEEKEFDKILDYVSSSYQGYSSGNTSNLDANHIVFKHMDGLLPSVYSEDRTGALLPVYHGDWKSFKKIGYLTTVEGELEIVDETYKVVEGETIEWDWITEWWEGYKTGEDIYFGIQPMEYQEHSIDNPNVTRGAYTGGAYGYNNSKKKSLVDIMKPLQYIYLILWYRLELTLARDKGKIINMDITQIPKGMGIGIDQWLHYLTSMSVNFFNPYDEGWNVPGREGGKPSQFNQFGQTDLTMGNVIAEYINLMAKVEEMIGELSGVSKQRQGSISASELVGNVERAVVQSSHITEPLFYRHNQIKKRALTNLLNVAKFAWKVHDKKKINFVLSGPERMFIDINEEFLYSDHDVFLSDSTKEHQDIQSLRTLYQPAMQNGASLLEIATIMTENNMSEIKGKLSEIEKRKAESLQAQAQAEQELQLQANQVQADGNRIKEEDSIRKAETSITVALIQAESGNDVETSQPEEIDLDSINLEREKLNLQQKKIENDYKLNSQKVKETERHNKVTEQVSKMTKKSTTNNK
jgi:hypothetical protein